MRKRELTRREMQLLGYVERHGAPLAAQKIALVVGIPQATQVNATLRRLRAMGYLKGAQLTDAGRHMLWPLGGIVSA